MVVHDLGQILLIFNFLTIDSNDQVAAKHNWAVAEIRALGAATQPCTVGRATGKDLNHEQTEVRGQPHLFRQFRRDWNCPDP